jgi:hypothetical protein
MSITKAQRPTAKIESLLGNEHHTPKQENNLLATPQKSKASTNTQKEYSKGFSLVR